MKPLCPKCRRAIPAEHVNMEKWVLLCPDCGELFPIPEVREKEEPIEIWNLPRGITLSPSRGGFVLKTSLRTAAAFLLIPFTAVWAGVSMGGLYGGQIIKGKFEWFPSLFGLPFLAGSVFLVTLCLLTIAGSTIVKVDASGGVVSTGVGFLRRRRCFDPSEVKDVEYAASYGRNSSTAFIVLSGERRIKIPLPSSVEREKAYVKLLRQELRAIQSPHDPVY